MLKSKDYKKILKNIVEENSVYIFTNGNDKERYTDKHIMYEYAKQLKVKDKVMRYMEVLL